MRSRLEPEENNDGRGSSGSSLSPVRLQTTSDSPFVMLPRFLARSDSHGPFPRLRHPWLPGRCPAAAGRRRAGCADVRHPGWRHRHDAPAWCVGPARSHDQDAGEVPPLAGPCLPPAQSAHERTSSLDAATRAPDKLLLLLQQPRHQSAAAAQRRDAALRQRLAGRFACHP